MFDDPQGDPILWRVGAACCRWNPDTRALRVHLDSDCVVDEEAASGSDALERARELRLYFELLHVDELTALALARGR